jgi:DNA-binding transcriptional regulator YdaS (Cro superfamily)
MPDPENLRAADVIARFGGQSALARSLGLNQSTVQHWAKTGQIPVWRHAEVLRAARERGIALERSQLGAVRQAMQEGVEPPGPGVQPGARPVFGFGRTAGTAVSHGWAEALPTLEGEIGAMREQLGQLSEVVRRLADEVAALRQATSPGAPLHQLPGDAPPRRAASPRRRSPR